MKYWMVKVFFAASLGWLWLTLACTPVSSSPNQQFSIPPGAPPAPNALTHQLFKAYKSKGKKYKPRTHHLQKDGSPTFINRLIFETSPYLLQHAHNPVNWQAWGDEAFEQAQKDDKPVLLSIGYSTCHWCHVMERESFEDIEIATYINQNFIAIKVDREERPDVDDIYMSVVQGLTGRGGWPMTTVLTPKREAFFGGTYFPARDGDRGSRKGFFTILKELKAQYTHERSAVVSKAGEITQKLQRDARPVPPSGIAPPSVLSKNAQRLAQRFERQFGGFSNQTKFPRPANLDFLLRYHRRTNDKNVLYMVTHTLDHMYWGGMYDHVGGGFHRYSVDRKWLVPHFEKMLYDNAQLADIYTEAYQQTHNKRYAFVAQNILDYVQREMTSPAGPFYSATDADSPSPQGHDEEGLYFTWTPQEVTDILGQERASVFTRTFNFKNGGNFEGRNIPHLTKPLDETALFFQLDSKTFQEEISSMKKALYDHRQNRAPPIRDDKFLVSWNGLMIGAMAKAALTFQRYDYLQTATKAANFILTQMTQNQGRLYRTHFGGENRYQAYLDDYAFFIHGLLNLFDTTGEVKWLNAAINQQKLLDQYHWDPTHGAYFMTASDAEKLLVRDKPKYDGAEPSGNSLAAHNLLRLHTVTTTPSYKKRVEQLFSAFGRQLKGNALGVPKMLAALERYYDKSKEVVIVFETKSSKNPLVDVFRAAYLPNAIMVSGSVSQLKASQQQVPWLENKISLQGQPTAYVCEEGRCERPTFDSQTFLQQLKKIEDLLPQNEIRPITLADPIKNPKPWQYNPSTNQHWHPGHGHWHDGPPPAGAQ